MMDIHYWLVRIKYTFLVEPMWIWKYYRPFQIGKQVEPSRYVFMADGKRPHGGMFDRIKGILSVYALAKAQQADFKIHFVSPFDLRIYLDENLYHWKTGNDELCFSYPMSRPLIVYGECFHPQRLLRRRKGETHVYYGFDSIEEINNKYGTRYEFGALYRELFKPGKILQQKLNQQKTILGNHYIVCHIRFTNLLGDTIEAYGGGCKVLNESERNELMAACRDMIGELMARNPGGKMLLTTDSNRFVNYIKTEIPEVCFIEGNVKHVDTVDETTDDENMKLFLDYYMIAEASSVYSLVGGDLYPSQFPKYAAKIGGVPFERVWVKGYQTTPWIIQ